MVVRFNRGGQGEMGTEQERGEGVVQEVDCLHLDEVWASNVQLSGEHVPLGQGETQRSTIAVCPRLHRAFSCHRHASSRLWKPSTMQHFLPFNLRLISPVNIPHYSRPFQAETSMFSS